MPYARNIDVPGNILDSLPPPAQDTYRAAFNKACIYYRDDSKTKLEDVAHSVAWASLEQNFHRSEDGQWIPDSAD